MGSQGVGDFSYKYLLIPSILRWSNDTLPVQYTVSMTVTHALGIVTVSHTCIGHSNSQSHMHWA